MACQPNRSVRRLLQKLCSNEIQLQRQARYAPRCFSSSSQRRSYATPASASLFTTGSTKSITAVELPGLPQFRMKGSDVQVLYEPSIFYQTLLGQIRKAKRRIFLASLYIGKEETELIRTLHSALADRPELELHILVDCLRSTREHPSGPSSASLLAGLQAAFPKQVHISLYHTPALHGLVRKWVPKRYNEGWGLWHGKIYGFDDNVIISGANLSRDYFTNRQDRYIHFRNNPPLADYFHTLLGTFKRLTYAAEGGSPSAGSSALDIRWKDAGIARPDQDSRKYTNTAKEALQDFLVSYTARSSSDLSALSQTDEQADTLLQPFLQMGPFDIKQETDLVVPYVIRTAQSLSSTRIDWTSGYFSLRKQDRDALLSSSSDVSIVCASPEANGFFQSAGFSYYIPPAYTYLERKFFDEIVRRGQRDSIELREWKRDGWTYHAKGVWLSPSSLNAEEDSRNPFLTLVGSTNYGNRSAVRDLEVNLAVQTSSKELRAALGEEIRNIKQYATDKVNEKLFKRKDRHVGWINRLAARAIADML